MIKSFLYKALNFLVFKKNKLVYQNDLEFNYPERHTKSTDKHTQTFPTSTENYFVYPSSFIHHLFWYQELQKKRAPLFNKSFTVLNSVLIYPYGVVMDENKKIVMPSVRNRNSYLSKTGLSKQLLLGKITTQKKLKKVISLIDILDANYYHFVLDVLPRLRIYFEMKDIGEEVTLVVRKSMSEFQLQWLKLLNVDFSDLLAFKENLLAEEIIIPPLTSNKVVLPQKVYSFILDRGALSWLRNSAVEQVSTTSNFSKRVLVLRPVNSGRGIVNKQELQDALSTLGFKVVSLEDLNVAEQVNLFFHAECVISVHGAALANLLFCKKCLVIEIFPEARYTDSASIYCQITQYFNNNHTLFVAPSIGSVENVSIDIPSLTKVLSEKL